MGMESLYNEEDRRVVREFVNMLNESAYLVETDGTVVVANTVLAERLGIPIEEIEGGNIFELLPDDAARERRGSLSEVLRCGMPLVFAETRDDCHYLNSVRPVKDERGGIACLAFIGFDITDSKRTEDALRRANAELEGYGHAVAHDIRGPLAAAAIGADLLVMLAKQSDTATGWTELVKTAGLVRSNVEKAVTLVEGLLELAQAGNAPVRAEPLEIRDLVLDILDEHAREIRKREVKVIVPDSLGTVTADRIQIYQVFSNLIANSLRYNNSAQPMLEFGYLGVDASGRHRFIVRDNGPGIPSELQDTIFLPFVSGGHDRPGIGLSLVEKISAAYGGYARVRNDNGACFEIAIADRAVQTR
ncbi:MAG: PAS domain-containing sensor histidine kinase [Actinobacteria bacterium]|nr:PAS domain-containing sensor histidine kinase [Actinomycetota bacterium]MBU2688022.1 PAS domain-containing sensor histidine kinase [Actinomycetota bacterium]